jgi:hypothetical protein
MMDALTLIICALLFTLMLKPLARVCCWIGDKLNWDGKQKEFRW